MRHPADPMRLAYKFSLGAAIGMSAVLGVSAAVEVQREIEVYETDLVNSTAKEARILSVSVAQLWSTFGSNGAVELLAAANSAARSVRAEWVAPKSLRGEGLRLDDGEIEALHAGKAVARVIAATPTQERAALALSPVIMEHTMHGAVMVSQVALAESHFIRRAVQRAATTAAGLLLVSWLAAYFLGLRWVRRPVALLVGKARRIGQGDFSQPLVLATGDELTSLAEALNAMTTELATARELSRRETEARLAALEQVRRADRLATVGRLAAGLAHELGTPLNVVSERTKMARAGEVEPQNLSRTYDIIIDQVERMAGKIRQLLDFARQQPPTKSRTNLSALLAGTQEILSPLLRKRSITVRMLTPPEAWASVDPVQLRQVIMNLAMNAIGAMDKPGVITVALDRARSVPEECKGRENAKWWALSVADEGRGIEPHHLSLIFDPFFTTKDAGEGTGLGLSIVLGIVREHGGAIEVASTPGEGATFTIYLEAEADA